MTYIDKIEALYVIQSHSLYLNADDENGSVVVSPFRYRIESIRRK